VFENSKVLNHFNKIIAEAKRAKLRKFRSFRYNCEYLRSVGFVAKSNTAGQRCAWKHVNCNNAITDISRRKVSV